MTPELRMPARAARRLAETAVQAVADMEEQVEKGHVCDFALKRFFQHRRELGGRDRRFISNLVFSCFRWRGWVLPAFGKNRAAACFHAWLLDAETVHPAADALAAMAGIATPDASSLGGAKNVREKLPIFKERLSHPVSLSESDLVPAWLADAMYTPPDTEQSAHFHRWIESCQSRPPTWLRMTTGQEDACLDELVRHGFEPIRHPAVPHAISLTTPIPYGALHALRHGGMEIQDLASQCVGFLCDPKPGERWWDLCAGSGGKSLHLADLMQDRGRITSTDIRPGILRQLALRIGKTRFTCIAPERSIHPPAHAPTPCDGVLVDAPCSGIGTWSRNPDARWRTSPETVALKADRQRELLDIAASAVRAGGRLVYSVCTVTARETVEVVHAFLARHADFAMETVRHPLSGRDVHEGAWIWPWDGPCDGMFIAALRKTS